MGISEFKIGLELVMPFVFLIIWAIRLEGRVNYIEKLTIEAQKDIDLVRSLQAIHENRIAEQLAQVRESLARIEGYLKLKDDHH